MRGYRKEFLERLAEIGVAVNKVPKKTEIIVRDKKLLGYFKHAEPITEHIKDNMPSPETGWTGMCYTAEMYYQDWLKVYAKVGMSDRPSEHREVVELMEQLGNDMIEQEKFDIYHAEYLKNGDPDFPKEEK